MALPQRQLLVQLSFSNGDVVTLDNSMNLRVNIEKNVLAMQNKCEVEVTNLNSERRAQLLSQFTAWFNNQAQQGNVTPQIVQVAVVAGYTGQAVAQIFVGEVTQCQMTTPPPNVTLKIVCFTRQVDKSKQITGTAPLETTYQEYVQWAVSQMNNNLLPNQQELTLDFKVDERIASATVDNPAASRYHVSSLLYDIQDMYKPDAVAFVDDLVLVVRDKGAVLQQGQSTDLDQFVGIPGWNEWGIEAQVIFVPTLKLATAVTLISSLNPQVNGDYVVTSLQYNLTAREEPFYIKFKAMPPADITS